MAVFTDTVTIYNHYKENGADKWKKTVIEGCQWSDHRDLDIDTDGKLLIANYATISIPMIDGYVKPEDFNGTGFTFNPGDLDVIAIGEQSTVITDDNIDAVCRGDDFMTIISVNDNTNRDHLKFWRLTAA